MAYTDSNGIAYLQDTDPVDALHTTINQIPTSMSNWINGRAQIRYAADTAARVALASTFPPSTSAPLYVHQQNTGVLWQNNGSGWFTVKPTTDLVSSTNTYSTNASGDATINYGQTFTSVSSVVVTSGFVLGSPMVFDVSARNLTNFVVRVRNSTSGAVAASANFALSWIATGTLATS